MKDYFAILETLMMTQREVKHMLAGDENTLM